MLLVGKWQYHQPVDLLQSLTLNFRSIRLFTHNRQKFAVNDFYKALGIPQTANQDEVKWAFFVLSKKYHPDIAGPSEMSTRKYMQIREAYETLKDAKRRLEYDRQLRVSAPRESPLSFLPSQQKRRLPAAKLDIRRFLASEWHSPITEKIRLEDQWFRIKAMAAGFVLFLISYYVSVRIYFTGKI